MVAKPYQPQAEAQPGQAAPKPATAAQPAAQQEKTVNKNLLHMLKG